jgi:hypothetical protein
VLYGRTAAGDALLRAATAPAAGDALLRAATAPAAPSSR